MNGLNVFSENSMWITATIVTNITMLGLFLSLGKNYQDSIKAINENSKKAEELVEKIIQGHFLIKLEEIIRSSKSTREKARIIRLMLTNLNFPGTLASTLIPLFNIHKIKAEINNVKKHLSILTYFPLLVILLSIILILKVSSTYSLIIIIALIIIQIVLLLNYNTLCTRMHDASSREVETLEKVLIRYTKYKDYI